MRLNNTVSVDPANLAAFLASKELPKKLMSALQSQEDGDSTAIDAKQLPGKNAKAKYAELDKKYDGVEAEEFTFNGQTWYAISAAVDQASDSGYWFFSKNDVAAGYAEDDR